MNSSFGSAPMIAAETMRLVVRSSAAQVVEVLMGYRRTSGAVNPPPFLAGAGDEF